MYENLLNYPLSAATSVVVTGVIALAGFSLTCHYLYKNNDTTKPNNLTNNTTSTTKQPITASNYLDFHTLPEEETIQRIVRQTRTNTLELSYLVDPLTTIKDIYTHKYFIHSRLLKEFSNNLNNVIDLIKRLTCLSNIENLSLYIHGIDDILREPLDTFSNMWVYVQMFSIITVTGTFFVIVQAILKYCLSKLKQFLIISLRNLKTIYYSIIQDNILNNILPNKTSNVYVTLLTYSIIQLIVRLIKYIMYY